MNRVIKSEQYLKMLCSLYDKAVKCAEKAKYFNPKILADIYHDYGFFLHENNREWTMVEKYYQEALLIYRILAKDHPEKFNPFVARSLNNIALLHKNMENYEAAEKENCEALGILLDLAEKDPDKYMPYVAISLKNAV